MKKQVLEFGRQVGFVPAQLQIISCHSASLCWWSNFSSERHTKGARRAFISASCRKQSFAAGREAVKKRGGLLCCWDETGRVPVFVTELRKKFVRVIAVLVLPIEDLWDLPILSQKGLDFSRELTTLLIYRLSAKCSSPKHCGKN